MLNSKRKRGVSSRIRVLLNDIFPIIVKLVSILNLIIRDIEDLKSKIEDSKEDYTDIKNDWDFQVFQEAYNLLKINKIFTDETQGYNELIKLLTGKSSPKIEAHIGEDLTSSLLNTILNDIKIGKSVEKLVEELETDG